MRKSRTFPGALRLKLLLESSWDPATLPPLSSCMEHRNQGQRSSFPRPRLSILNLAYSNTADPNSH